MVFIVALDWTLCPGIPSESLVLEQIATEEGEIVVTNQYHR